MKYLHRKWFVSENIVLFAAKPSFLNFHFVFFFFVVYKPKKKGPKVLSYHIISHVRWSTVECVPRRTKKKCGKKIDTGFEIRTLIRFQNDFYVKQQQAWMALKTGAAGVNVDKRLNRPTGIFLLLDIVKMWQMFSCFSKKLFSEKQQSFVRFCWQAIRIRWQNSTNCFSRFQYFLPFDWIREGWSKSVECELKYMRDEY